MLQHSTGDVNSITLEGSVSDDALDDFINSTVAEQCYQMNPPGLFYGYCNPGYSLAGHAARKTCRASPLLEAEISVLTPLSLTATTFDPAEVMSATNYATGTSEGASITPDQL